MSARDYETSRPSNPESASDYDPKWIRAHIAEERRAISMLGEIRELVFGAQDGLVSTLAVVATVAGASNDRTAVLVAGIAAAIAGVFSMGIGEYMSSKSQEEIAQAQIDDEWEEVRERPFEAEAELRFMFEEEGMAQDNAEGVAATIASNEKSLLATMIAKELGLVVDDHNEIAGSPLRGGLLMAGAFALGSVFPIAPFLFTHGAQALAASTLLTALALFSIGAAKSRWTKRPLWSSGLEIVLLAAVAGVAGYLFGTVLPGLLDF